MSFELCFMKILWRMDLGVQVGQRDHAGGGGEDQGQDGGMGAVRRAPFGLFGKWGRPQ